MKKIIFSLGFAALALGATAQVKIKDGTVKGSSVTPNPNAILELESNNKGLLLPRVQLTNTTTALSGGTMVAGMLVYNTATVTGTNGVTPGFYYSDGTQWIQLVSSNSLPGSTTGGTGTPLSDTIFYTESDSDFANPERGFYIHTETYANNYTPLDSNTIKTWRTNPQQGIGADYKVYCSLALREFVLTGFTNKPLSNSLLTKIQNDFDVARAAGIKIIPRFAYTLTTTAGSCPEGSICPPYGDAPKNIVLQHISQLKPILQKNADVIACVQLGFIGIWGENFYTDYFGDASQNGQGQLYNNNWQDRNDVLKAALDAVSTDRMVQVRLPQIKQRYVYGINAPTNSAPLTDAEAFTETDKARIGMHDDCFISSVDDAGTYLDYGNSSSPPKPALDALRTYAQRDNKYVAVGGETCSELYSPQNNCETAGIAQTEMNNMHYSFLNCDYNNNLNNLWVSGGCIENIKKNLGYRFVLINSVVPKDAVNAGTQLHVVLNLKNEGYASPYNPRNAKLVMRNNSTGREYVYDMLTNVQKWYTGNISIDENILMDSAMGAGEYALFLYLPDKYKSISGRSEYAIRLANANVWDTITGYNNLNTTVTIK